MTESIMVFLITTVLATLFALIGKLFVDMAAQRKGTVSLLRAEMTMLYYEYKDQKCMPYYIKEAWYACYEAYTALKANSFIKDMKREIDEWGVE